MKAYLINMHLLVPRSRSSAKVKVKYKGYISQKMAISGGICVSPTHLVVSSSKEVHVSLKTDYKENNLCKGDSACSV